VHRADLPHRPSVPLHRVHSRPVLLRMLGLDLQADRLFPHRGRAPEGHAMTSRERMLNDAIGAACLAYPFDRLEAQDVASAILDAILPEVSTVEELEALPSYSVLISAGGTLFHRHSGPIVGLAGAAAAALMPLTVVWRPET
jgi:hypothetical protein